MGVVGCILPLMPGHSALKEAFELKVYPPIHFSWAHYFMCTGKIEGIDWEAYTSGGMASYQALVDGARDDMLRSRDYMREALEMALEFRALLPEEDQKRLSPNIKNFYRMIRFLEEAAASLNANRIPELETLHGISALIREDMVFGERMAQINRGTRGHYEYPVEEAAEVDAVVDMYEAAG